MNIKNKKQLIFITSFLIICAIIFLPNFAFAQNINLSQQLNNPTISQVWRYILTLLNAVVVLGLVFIALANILRLNIETWQIKRLLPAIIIGIILANFSYLFCRIFVDLSQLVAVFFINEPVQLNGQILMNIFGIGDYIFSTGFQLAAFWNLILPTNFIAFIFLQTLFMVIPALFFYILGFLFIVRVYIIWAMVILSPFGLFCLMFTPLNKVWQVWWGWFIKWTFLLPLSFLFIRIAAEISRRGWVGQPADPTNIGGFTNGTMFAHWAFGVIMLGLAMYLPWKISGGIMGAWAGLWGRVGKLGLRAANQGRIGAGGWMSSKYKEGTWQNKLGKGLMSNPALLWQTRMEQQQKDVEEASYGGPMSFIAGKRAGTKMRISAAGTLEGQDAFTAIKIAGGDSALVDYYRKLKMNNKYAPQNQQEAYAERAISMLKERATKERPAAERLRQILSVDGANVDVANDDNFSDEREILSRTGIFTEQVLAEGTPQIPGRPRNNEDNNTESNPPTTAPLATPPPTVGSAGGDQSRLEGEPGPPPAMPPGLGGGLPNTREFARANARVVADYIKRFNQQQLDYLRHVPAMSEGLPQQMRNWAYTKSAVTPHLEGARKVMQESGDTQGLAKVDTIIRQQKVKQVIDVEPATTSQISSAINKLQGIKPGQGIGQKDLDQTIELVTKVSAKPRIEIERMAGNTGKLLDELRSADSEIKSINTIPQTISQPVKVEPNITTPNASSSVGPITPSAPKTQTSKNIAPPTPNNTGRPANPRQVAELNESITEARTKGDQDRVRALTDLRNDLLNRK